MVLSIFEYGGLTMNKEALQRRLHVAFLALSNKNWWIVRLQAAFWGANLATTFLLPIYVGLYLPLEKGPAFTLEVLGGGVFFMALVGAVFQADDKWGWSGWKYNCILVYGYYVPRYAMPWFLRWIGRRLGLCQT